MFDAIAIPSVPVLLAAMLVVTLASSIQAALGMGFGQTAAPLLLLLDPAFVPAATIMIGMLTSGLGASREFEHIRWPEVWLGGAARLLGIIVALLILTSLNSSNAFRLLFGLAVALAVWLSYSGWSLPFNWRTLAAMGGISGLMGTITGVGAPPLALIYQNRNPLTTRPTLAAFFCLGCALSVTGLWWIGWLGKTQLLLAVLFLPAMALGTWLGRQVNVTSTAHYRQSLLGIAALAAFILVFQGLWGLYQ